MEREDRDSRVALAMFVVLLLSYVINSMDRQIFSVLAADVRQALSIDLPRIGLAATIFTLGMGLAGLPTGYLLAKMSRRNVTLIGLALFSVATYLTSYSHGLGDLLIYRFLSGLGEAMQLTAMLAIGRSLSGSWSPSNCRTGRTLHRAIRPSPRHAGRPARAPA